MLILEGSPTNGPQPTLRKRLVDLVSFVGSEQFESQLSNTMAAEFSCRHMTVFAFRPQSPPRVVSLVANDTKTDAVKRAAAHYMDKYWAVDPSNLFNRAPIDSRSYAVVLSDTDVDDFDFKHDCYFRTGIAHRLSLITELNSECLKISFHRGNDAGAFETDNVGQLLEHGDILASLILRHHEMITARQSDSDPERFEAILESRHPQLTNRERRVCSLIAIGMSSEAIALTLGVSINTILTFRRRAYARLNISTQNELMRLLFRAQN